MPEHLINSYSVLVRQFYPQFLTNDRRIAVSLSKKKLDTEANLYLEGSKKVFKYFTNFFDPFTHALRVSKLAVRNEG